MIIQKFCSRSPLLQKFSILYFWASPYAEQYLSSSAVDKHRIWVRGKMGSFLRMPVHQLCLRAIDDPISAIYGGCSANDKAQNMISLKTAVCDRTPNEWNVMLVISTELTFSRKHLCYAIWFAGQPLFIALIGPTCALLEVDAGGALLALYCHYTVALKFWVVFKLFGHMYHSIHKTRCSVLFRNE